VVEKPKLGGKPSPSSPGTTQRRIGRYSLPCSAPNVGDQTTSESIPGVARDARAPVISRLSGLAWNLANVGIPVHYQVRCTSPGLT